MGGGLPHPAHPAICGGAKAPPHPLGGIRRDKSAKFAASAANFTSILAVLRQGPGRAQARAPIFRNLSVVASRDMFTKGNKIEAAIYIYIYMYIYQEKEGYNTYICVSISLYMYMN